MSTGEWPDERLKRDHKCLTRTRSGDRAWCSFDLMDLAPSHWADPEKRWSLCVEYDDGAPFWPIEINVRFCPFCGKELMGTP